MFIIVSPFAFTRRLEVSFALTLPASYVFIGLYSSLPTQLWPMSLSQKQLWF